MNLHRAERKPDWEKVEPSKRNSWQKVAAATKGVVTPGNIVTATGYGLFELGLRDIKRQRTLRGISTIAIARGFDLLDGIVADKTGTKSPLGEAFDATVDKIEAVRGLPTLLKANILPRTVAVSYLAQNGVNTAATLIAKQRGVEIHPSQSGKVTAALQWASVGLYGLGAARPESAYPVDVIADTTAAAATALGVQASSEYLTQAMTQQQASEVDYHRASFQT